MIIAIVGLSGSGKDTVAKYINKKYDIPMLVSYTTRPIRDYETDGKEHWFITKEKMDEIKANEELIAYTINDKTGIEYCATKSQVEGKDIIYIINPEGIYWLKKNCPDVEMKTLMIKPDKEVSIERLRKRGDKEEVLQLRLSSEFEEFEQFYQNGDYDYLIANDGTLEDLYDKTNQFMTGE